MTRPSKDEAELGAWSTQVAPDGWVRDQQWSHPDPAFTDQLAEARRRSEAAHAIVTSLAELRRAVGLSQTELAEQWGHTQSFVSRVERDVTNVEMATLVGYVKALGGRLTITVEAGDRIFHEDLLVGP
ncbi:MAG: helix-turn-helix domain-containing protein [Acidimicrobiales bacterium]